MALLAEYWQWSPEQTLRLPISRRKRMLRWKERHTRIVDELQNNKGHGRKTFDVEDLEYIWQEPII